MFYSIHFKIAKFEFSSRRVNKFIVKTMQPISIVERDGFRELIEYLEPSFVMPTRFKVKESCLPAMKALVEDRIRNELKLLDSVNVSLDGWSDGIMRCFNGYIAQGCIYNFIFLIGRVLINDLLINISH